MQVCDPDGNVQAYNDYDAAQSYHMDGGGAMVHVHVEKEDAEVQTDEVASDEAKRTAPGHEFDGIREKERNDLVKEVISLKTKVRSRIACVCMHVSCVRHMREKEE